MCVSRDRRRSDSEKDRDARPDLVIVDSKIPALDGFGAAKQISTFWPAIQILSFSWR
jgi:DNA-binding response OmpR family regulator